MYPTLSRQAARNNIAGVKKTIRDLIVVMGVFVIPITVGGMILSTPLMTLLYHRGAFTMVDVTNTAQIFFISCLSFFPFVYCRSHVTGVLFIEEHQAAHAH